MLAHTSSARSGCPARSQALRSALYDRVLGCMRKRFMSACRTKNVISTTDLLHIQNIIQQQLERGIIWSGVSGSIADMCRRQQTQEKLTAKERPGLLPSSSACAGSDS